jgi:hypothetical protein
VYGLAQAAMIREARNRKICAQSFRLQVPAIAAPIRREHHTGARRILTARDSVHPASSRTLGELLFIRSPVLIASWLPVRIIRLKTPPPRSPRRVEGERAVSEPSGRETTACGLVRAASCRCALPGDAALPDRAQLW